VYRVRFDTSATVDSWSIPVALIPCAVNS
jgi:hypothetical protein